MTITIIVKFNIFMKFDLQLINIFIYLLIVSPCNINKVKTILNAQVRQSYRVK